jgi:hypothetical protein
MNAKEEITKLIRESYDQGVKDAQQETLTALEQIVAAARADEREACAKEVENALYGQEGCGKAAKAVRARGEA